MSFWTSTKRVTRYGLVGFVRNGFVSFSAVFMMVITLFVVGSLMLANAALSTVLDDINKKVDINVYFATSAQEDTILALKRQVEALPEVAEVNYVSREDALIKFKEKRQGDQLTLQALEELKENPLGASIAIRAKQTSQYEGIARFLDTSPFVAQGDSQIVERVNYFQNKKAIDKLSEIIDTSNKVSLIVMLVLVLASILITLNTVRLAIYTARDEIAVMRLVGASHWYVRGPFIISGASYGVVAGLFVAAAMYPLSLWASAASRQFFGSFDTLTYYTANFAHISTIIMLSGIGLGIISSFIATRRYLR
jgi:cell division transport system permease protein